MTESPSKNKPFDVAEYRGVEVPIWRNEGEEGRVRYSTSPASKSYYDKKAQKWKRTSTLYGEENGYASIAYRRADEQIEQHEKDDYQQRKAAVNEQPSQGNQAAA